MNSRPRRDSSADIALVCEGDASPDGAFSGSVFGMATQLRDLGHEIATINTRPPRGTLGLIAATAFSPNKARWRARYRYGGVSAAVRSRIAERAFLKMQPAPDIVLQMGGAAIPPGRGCVPYAIYSDWTFALSIQNRANEYSAIHHMPVREAERINRREASVYRGAAAIFTISERLRQAFIDDYGVAPDRVFAACAGPNIALSHLVPPSRSGTGRPPSILFIGKEFHRKGGDVLLKAFGLVRQTNPTARLVIVGPTALPGEVPAGVELLGMLRKDVPDEFERLLEAYRQADVFCLPSRQDPFPTVVREAMFFGLPCVTSNIWAMPEMVVDGETGFTVPADSPELLADRLCQILASSDLRSAMGAAARRRAEARYTWAAAAAVMHQAIQSIVGTRLDQQEGSGARTRLRTDVPIVPVPR